jgi:hypothetical protein
MSGRAILVAAMVVALGPVVPAQGQPAGSGGRFEISLGGGWSTGEGLGSVTAQLTGTQSSGAGVTLFETASSIEAGPVVDVRLGWRFGWLALESAGHLTSGHLATRITSDLEGAAPMTARASLIQVGVGAMARVHVGTIAALGGRLRPFVSGGGAYLRQIHEGRLSIDTGTLGSVGAGVLWHPGAGAGRIGLRSDVCVRLRRGGVEVTPQTHRSVSVTASLYFTP